MVAGRYTPGLRLQDCGDALAAGRADRDEATHRLARLGLLLGELLGQLRDDASAGGRERWPAASEDPLTLSLDRSMLPAPPFEAKPLLAVLLGLNALSVASTTDANAS